tara:strand:+ start:307 stop:918 length:612 start_codon:yes stop_codon:yes gene_type:complete
MNRPIMKELSLEPSTGDLEAVAILLDCLEMAKVKTKYAKTGWDAISLHGYGPNPEDILKPGVLKSSVDIDTKLQWTSLKDNEVMKPVLEMLDKLPCKFERVRFMKLEAGKVIGKHTDKIDKQIGFGDGDIIRIHMPIRTNDQVVFTLYESTKDKDGTEYNLKTGHYYYTDVTKAHAVRNTSDIDRIHLVADCYSNEKMRALLN